MACCEVGIRPDDGVVSDSFVVDDTSDELVSSSPGETRCKKSIANDFCLDHSNMARMRSFLLR